MAVVGVVVVQVVVVIPVVGVGVVVITLLTLALTHVVALRSLVVFLLGTSNPDSSCLGTKKLPSPDLAKLTSKN